MFFETDCLERHEFSVLHKVVLGLVTAKDLETELQASTADINILDANRRTPVSLAAERGDLHALSVLLKYGANPNIPDVSGATPLHHAVTAREPDCIQPLLEAGAHINCCTNWDQTPLHFLAAYQSDPRFLAILLRAGANINARDRDGIAPLAWTAITNRQRITEGLLAHGADAGARDNSGRTALVECIHANSHEVLEVLVRNGADAAQHLLLNRDINSWLFIAEAADLRTMQLLQELQWRDVYAVDDSELMVARESLRNRSDASPDLIEVFEAIVQQVIWNRGDWTARSAGSGADEDSEIWEDALDTLEL